MRVLLDTNVLISGLAYPSGIPGKILTAWSYGSFDVVLSSYILEEFRPVLPKLAHRHALTSQQIDDLVDIYSIKAEIVEPLDVEPPELRDRTDAPILGSFEAAKQTGLLDYIISGDKDLLVLVDRYPVLSPSDFWQRHQGVGLF